VFNIEGVKMNKKWTKKEEGKLITLWNKGLTIKQIAEVIKNKDMVSVRNKTQYLRRKGILQGRRNKTNVEVKDDNTLGESNMTEQDSTNIKIIKTIEDIRLFLLKKNEQYGDSALEPIRIFSKADKHEQLKVRIDDKLNRLVQGNADIESDEDVVKDLIGYLILLLISMKDN